jgi:phenylpropionate dioxygenase-like ring-hydroxylating dioxygenase large terminal subunit
MAGLANARLKHLVTRQKPGHALERPFYVSPEIFYSDLERVVRKQWLFVDHVSRIPNIGDYIAYEIAGESILVARHSASEICALYNVCRHRGSRICLQASGNVRRLICPYHAWVYDLKGRLIGAQGMPDGFDMSEWSLVSCPVRLFEGLIFINLGSEADTDDFDEIVGNLEPFLVQHGIAEAKVAHQEAYPTDGNWKLVVENFRECYHCAVAHPEYTSIEAHVRANIKNPGSYDLVTAEWEKTVKALGHVIGSFDSGDELASQPHMAFRRPIRAGWMTHSQNGEPLAPLMGKFNEFDGGQTVVFIGPLFSIIGLNDHVILFRFTPMGPTRTEVTLTWLVDQKARKGIDYDVSRLKWLWDVTTLQDTKIIGDNQSGVNSLRYTPGPYSLREPHTSSFTKWYLSLMAR